MEIERPERREDPNDLALAKEHLLEMYHNILPLLQMDQVKNERAKLILADINNISSALDVKTSFEQLKELDPDVEHRGSTINEQQDNLARLAFKRYINKVEK